MEKNRANESKENQRRGTTWTRVLFGGDGKGVAVEPEDEPKKLDETKKNPNLRKWDWAQPVDKYRVRGGKTRGKQVGCPGREKLKKVDRFTKKKRGGGG